MTPSAPTSTGFTKPNSAIEPAICATWASECVRALRACGINRASGQRSTVSGNDIVILFSCCGVIGRRVVTGLVTWVVTVPGRLPLPEAP